MKPQILVLFGITGDLAESRLLPSLWQHDKNGVLSKQVQVVGVGRSEYTNQTIREYVQEKTKCDDEFKQRFFYVQGSLAEDETYHKIADQISNLQEEKSLDPTAITYYYSIPPRFFESVTQQLAKHDLAGKEGEYKVAFEKPFGRDLDSARKLNQALTNTFCEEQIYRIDHYLAKSAVDNILTFRFGNTIYDAVLCRDHVESIEVIAAETKGVGERAGYYEDSGALRDMIQNHLMQTLSLLIAHKPEDMSAKAIHEAKAQAIEKLRIGEYVRGQYIEGNGMRAYKDEDGVDQDSQTETYVALSLLSSDERWKKVPMTLISGKRLPEKLTQITVRFHKPMLEGSESNVLRIQIQPEEVISIQLNTHTPRPERKLVQQHMEYCHDCVYGERIPDAYETVLEQLLKGDKTIFSSWREVEASWKLLQPLLEQPEPLYYYESGSWGPAGEDK